MKVIKQYDFPDLKIKRVYDSETVIYQKVGCTEDYIVIEDDKLFEFISDITPIKKLQELISYLKELDATK